MRTNKKIFFLLFFLALVFVPRTALATDACAVDITQCLSPVQPTFWLVTTTALVDAINPCAIAVMLLLLSALLFFENKRRLLISRLANYQFNWLKHVHLFIFNGDVIVNFYYYITLSYTNRISYR